MGVLLAVDAMWVPSLLVMSGRTQSKGAKATSTDSPPKGYGTPNLVVLLVAGWSQVSLYLGTGLWSRVSVSLLPGSIKRGATHRWRPA